MPSFAPLTTPTPVREWTRIPAPGGGVYDTKISVERTG